MNRHIRCLSLLIIAFLIPVSSEECELTMEMGSTDAEEQHPTCKYFFIGMETGLILPVFGPVIASVPCSKIRPVPDNSLVLQHKNRDCFIRGYSEQARKKSLKSLKIGGIIGSGITVYTIILIIVINNFPIHVL